MDITPQTKVGDLLDAYPRLESTLLGLSPSFSKLRNPVLRRTVAKVVTLQQAAKVAGISPAQMVQTLRKEAGLSGLGIEDANDDGEKEAIPSWFDESKISVRFDAGPIIESGGSPMQEIIKLTNQLRDGDMLELMSPFKPIPLIDLLKSKGFKVWHNGVKTYIAL